MMELRKLQKIAVSALEDIKAKDIEVINTARSSPLFDRVVIASGDSNRQVRALARNVADKVREAGGEVLSMEGEENGEWVLVDLGDIVVHVMQPAIRAYYNLEDLWVLAHGEVLAHGALARGNPLARGDSPTHGGGETQAHGKTPVRGKNPGHP